MAIPNLETCLSTTSSTGSNRRLNFTGCPFSFSTVDNTFISVGCDNFATITSTAPTVFGCSSDCTPSMESGGLRCSGFNCCEATNIPSYLQEFAVDFRSLSESCNFLYYGEIVPCRYAFLVDQNWLKESKPDPSFVQYWEYVPVVLDWQVNHRTINTSEFHGNRTIYKVNPPSLGSTLASVIRDTKEILIFPSDWDVKVNFKYTALILLRITCLFFFFF